MRAAAAAIVVAGALLGALSWGTGASAASPASKETPRVDRVLILSMPFVSWEDLDDIELPNLERLLRGSAIGAVSTRAPTLEPTLPAGYLTISAGDHAVGSVDSTRFTSGDGAAFAVDEEVGDDTAHQVYERRTGRPAGDGIVHLGIAEILEANHDSLFDPAIGVLGETLQRAGVTRAVVANADGSEPPLLPPIHRRYAVAALMGPRGRLPDGGAVGTELQREDSRAPFGLRLDVDAAEHAFADVWTSRSVVLVEASDVVRADAYLALGSEARQQHVLRQALRWTDALVGRLLDRIDLEHDAVLVVGPATNEEEPTLTVAALHAPGVEPGLLRSDTTQRDGFVQLMDVAPTVLDLLGVPRPESMRGRALEVGDSGDSFHDRRETLIDADEATLFRDDILVPAAVVFITFAALVALGAALALHGVGGARLRTVSEVGALAVLGFIPAVFLARIPPFHDWGLFPYWAFLVVASVALGFAFRACGRRDPFDPVLIGVGLIVAVLALDVLFGSRLQFNNAFGYSPEIGGRFVGFGNVGFCVVATAALFLAALLVRRVGTQRGVLIGVGVLAVVVLLVAVPFWGADVSDVLAVVPAFGLAAWLLVGRRLGLSTVGVAAAATVLIAAAAALIDGGSGIGTFVRRKIELNVDSLAHSHWRPMVLLAIAFLAYVAWVPPRPLRALVEQVPSLRAALIGVAIVAGIGYLSNDAGILVPGVVLGVLTVALAALLLIAPADATAARRAVPTRAGRQPRRRSARTPAP